MRLNESTRLLGKSGLEGVRINIMDSDSKEKIASIREYYSYYTAEPLWIRIRLCLFWSFWAAFVTVVVLFVLISLCVLPTTCHRNFRYSV